MDDYIEQVKAANKIQDVMEEGGFQLERRHGKYVRSREHDSLVVDVQKQAYHWNSNNESGDVISWIMKRQGWDFKSAVEWLARRAKLPEPRWSREEGETRKARRELEDVFVAAQGVFARWLMADEEALGYVHARGWTDETLEESGLGFSGRGTEAQYKEMRGELQLRGIDPESPLAVGIVGLRGDVKAWGQKYGIAVEEHDWAQWGLIPGLMGKKRLIYPHYWGGRVRTFSSRNILGDQYREVEGKRKEVKGFNLPSILVGERQPFYNHVYGKGERVVVVEGQADAVTLGQWGIPAVALMGTGFQDQGQALRNVRTHNKLVYIGLDADEAGYKALIGKDEDWPLVELLGPMARVVRWPESTGPDGQKGKDANDWLRWGATTDKHRLRLDTAATQMGAEYSANTDESGKSDLRAEVEKLLEQAPALVDVIARWAGNCRGAEADRAQRFTFKVIGMMEKFDQRHYRRKLCELLGVGLREFDDLIKTSKNGDKGEEDAAPVETLGGFINGWLVEYLYDPEKDEPLLAWRDPEGRIGSGKSVVIEGRKFVPRAVNDFIRGGGVIFPSEVGAMKGTRELTAIVEGFIKQNYLLENEYLYRIMSYYVLMTWVYDSFNALCYLRAMGEAGAGKSELMRRVGMICYRLLSASGANSGASFFRATEQYRGTVFIDEADLHDGGDMSNDLVKFLNLGAMRGNPIWRLEEVMIDGGKTYEPRTYQTYCPKLIAMRKDFRDDAVGSRSLTIRLMPREPIELKAKGIRLYVDEKFRQQALTIRNLLLHWRLKTWEPEIAVTEDYMDLEISARLNQVTMPLKALAKDDPELRAEIERFLRAYNQEIVLNRSMTIAARVVEAMWRIWGTAGLRKKYVNTTQGENAFMLIGDVTFMANLIMDEMNEVDMDGDGKKEEQPMKRKKDELSARGVGHIIRNELQLQVGQRRGKGFPVFWDEIKMQALAGRYGVEVVGAVAEYSQDIQISEPPVEVNQVGMGI